LTQSEPNAELDVWNILTQSEPNAKLDVWNILTQSEPNAKLDVWNMEKISVSSPQMIRKSYFSYMPKFYKNIMINRRVITHNRRKILA